MQIDNFKIGVLAPNHSFAGKTPVLIRNIAFTNIGDVVFHCDENEADTTNSQPGKYDMVDSTRDGSPIQAADIRIVFAYPEFKLRVQNGTDAWEVDYTGSVTVIAPFYPMA
ncbi:MAG: hypothetical protein LC798_13795 [Chloroflexi bacterium]|nr:hypothetical protein [Chloroflexota bacterium]